MPLAELPNRKTQIICNLDRSYGLKGDLLLCEIAKEVIGVSAVVMDHNRIVSLSLPKVLNQSSAFIWHDDFLNCSTTAENRTPRPRVVKPCKNVDQIMCD